MCKGSAKMKKDTNSYCSLDTLVPGKSGRILSIQCEEHMRQRLLDMGFVKDSLITCEGESSHKDPKAFLLRGCVVALRNADSRHIFIQEVTS